MKDEILGWQKEELTKRKVAHSKGVSEASSWDSVKARIRSRGRAITKLPY
jgi:putative addiction module component (TIGR02574 family)